MSGRKTDWPIAQTHVLSKTMEFSEIFRGGGGRSFPTQQIWRHLKLTFLTLTRLNLTRFSNFTSPQIYTTPDLHNPRFTRRIYTNHHPQIYTPQFYMKFTQPLIYTFFQSVFYKVCFPKCVLQCVFCRCFFTKCILN